LAPSESTLHCMIVCHIVLHAYIRHFVTLNSLGVSVLLFVLTM